MVARTPYREALAKEATIPALRREGRDRLDPDCVAALEEADLANSLY
jgi:HD-GYP domain-containing protein (c-di-GMP phosphodiesterase class II)